MNKIAIFVVLGVLSYFFKPNPANAQTTEDLLNLCESSLPISQGACLGYVTSAGDQMQLNGAELNNLPASDAEGRQYLRESGLCVAEGQESPSKQALVKAFENWANANPQYWNEDEIVGVGAALATTWPCF